MGANIITPKILRIAFLVHGIYFVTWTLIFDFFVGPVAGFLNLPMPQTVIGWVATDIAAGELLAVAAFLLLAAWQAQIPRFIIVAAIIQTVYNLYHDVVWFWNKYPFGLVLLDVVLISVLFIIYVVTWYNTRDNIGGV